MVHPDPEGLGSEVRALLMLARDAYEPSTLQHLRVLERLELRLARAVLNALARVEGEAVVSAPKSLRELRGPAR
jgi:hypothetical protein